MTVEKQLDVRSYNRAAWNREVERGNRWIVPVDDDVIAAARRGEWHILLTPSKPVPMAWFPDLQGAEVLCLASLGGTTCPSPPSRVTWPTSRRSPTGPAT